MSARAVSDVREARRDLNAVAFYGNVPATLRRFALQHASQIEEVGGEGEDGYWVYLRRGLILQPDGTHSVHEWRVADVFTAFKGIAACNCVECADFANCPKGVVPISARGMTRQQHERAYRALLQFEEDVYQNIVARGFTRSDAQGIVEAFEMSGGTSTDEAFESGALPAAHAARIIAAQTR